MVEAAFQEAGAALRMYKPRPMSGYMAVIFAAQVTGPNLRVTLEDAGKRRNGNERIALKQYRLELMACWMIVCESPPRYPTRVLRVTRRVKHGPIE